MSRPLGGYRRNRRRLRRMFIRIEHRQQAMDHAFRELARTLLIAAAGMILIVAMIIGAAITR